MLMNHDSLKSQKTFKIVAVCIATIILGINMSYAQDGHRFLYGERDMREIYHLQ